MANESLTRALLGGNQILDVAKNFQTRFDAAEPWKAAHWLAYVAIGAGSYMAPPLADAQELAKAALALTPAAAGAWDADSLAESALALWESTAGPQPLWRAFALSDAGAVQAKELSDRAREILGAARVLARWYPQGFALPQVQLAEILGCSQPAVSAMLTRLVKLGYLELADSRFARGKLAKAYRLPRASGTRRAR